MNRNHRLKSMLLNKNAAGVCSRGVFRGQETLWHYEEVAYCRLSSDRSRLKYESNVTKPVVP